jgi:catechol-2,3-dioxygenase
MVEMTDVLFKPSNQSSIVKPFMLSHGTLECRSLKESRRFYEEFLGLECVRHAPQAMHARCGIKFSIVCVEVGNDVKPMSILNHWGLDVESRAAVDEAHKHAVAMKEKYKIGKITDPTNRHAVYSFYLEDLDGNYWEIEYYDGSMHEDAFDFGDRYPMDE